jgi:ketosteroid isomerase-like protein
MMTSIEVARAFIAAVQDKSADAAAELCADDVEVLLPGAELPLRGKEGVRQMIRMAPQFLQSMRDEEERDGEVRITTLTRSPGVFANYTTWRFSIDGDRVRRLGFDLRGAN